MNTQKDCRDCGHTNQACCDLLCHNRDKWIPKDDLARANAAAVLFDATGIKIQTEEEQCARQATLAFIERTSDVLSDDTPGRVLAKSCALGYFLGYMEGCLTVVIK